MSARCEWCDEIGPDVSPELAQRHEAHRALHDAGRAMAAALIDPWAMPLARWLDRVLAR